jgi:hypothetical protein
MIYFLFSLNKGDKAGWITTTFVRGLLQLKATMCHVHAVGRHADTLWEMHSYQHHKVPMREIIARNAYHNDAFYT